MSNRRKREKREFILRKFGEKMKEETSFASISRLTGIPRSTVQNFYQKGTGGRANILRICDALDWNKDDIFSPEEWAIINAGRGNDETLEEQLNVAEDLLTELDENTEKELAEEYQSLILKVQIIKAFAEYFRYETERLIAKATPNE